jgi:GDPmannose 4,6-dehydratase
LVKDIQPDYFINFAANSFVGCSWKMPLQVFDTNTTGVLRCLEAIKDHQPECKFYSAGSSEEFGDVDYSPQDLKHPLKPRSPYGASKCAARHLVKVYRESYNIFAVHATLFNHEGTKRGEEFVTRKITKGVARIKKSLENNQKIEPLELGNIYAKRDWSDSEDFVEGVWLMMTQEKPRDYLLASGETHTIKEFIERAFLAADIEGNWTEVENDPIKTKFHRNSAEGETLVKISEEFYRPNEVELLLGDPSRIKLELGWRPKVSFCNLVKKMVQHDLNEQE